MNGITVVMSLRKRPVKGIVKYGSPYTQCTNNSQKGVIIIFEELLFFKTDKTSKDKHCRLCTVCNP